MSPTVVRSKEPFGAPNFAQVLTRVPRYVTCIQKCGTRWMGIQFQYPILWLPSKFYTPAYNFSANWWKEVLLSDGFKVPGTEMTL